MNNKQFLMSVRNSCRKLTSEENTNDFLNTLNTLLDNEGGLLEEYFGEFIGIGSYKEAYQYGSLCIKFAVKECMDRERKIYGLASEAGISYAFCPTYYHELPTDMRLLLTELDWEYPESNDPRLDNIEELTRMPQLARYLVIQPMVNVTQMTSAAHYRESYQMAPLILNSGSIIPYSSYKRVRASLEWHQAAINSYGDNDYLYLIDKLAELKIFDLHEGNLGWFNDKPVIIDWLSSLC